jgi:hypothetical protein
VKQRDVSEIPFRYYKIHLTASQCCLLGLLMHLLLGIGLQNHVCTTENKIPKAKKELYEEHVKNNAILKINYNG